MSDLITAFLKGKMDESHGDIFDLVSKSEDPTVLHACEILLEYEECYDLEPHLICKQDWDRLERVRLVLLSDASLERTFRWRTGRQQLLSAASLIAMVVIFLIFGTGLELLIAAAVMSVLVLGILLIVPNNRYGTEPYKSIIEPFISFEQLATTYRSTTTFCKNRFPKRPKNQGVFSSIASFVCILLSIALLFVLAPIFLIGMALPSCDTEFKVAT